MVCFADIRIAGGYLVKSCFVFSPISPVKRTRIRLLCEDSTQCDMTREKDLSNRAFQPVSLESLRMGTLVDRSLYIFLPKNEKYLPVAKKFYPLEERAVAVIKEYGAVFSPDSPIESVYPRLLGAAHEVRGACDNDALAPFEKVCVILDATTWLVPLVQPTEKASPDLLPVLFFFYRAFSIPEPRTLTYVADISLELYERAISLSALCGVFALWLGYTDTAFLSCFVETVFCEDVAGEFLEGRIPGVGDQVWRLSDRLRTAREQIRSGAIGDELYELVEFARAVQAGEDRKRFLRIARKLGHGIKWEVEKGKERRAA